MEEQMKNGKTGKLFHTHHRQGGHAQSIDLTEGAIVKKIIQLAIPLFLGQLLQQFYNMADAPKTHIDSDFFSENLP